MAFLSISAPREHITQNNIKGTCHYVFSSGGLTVLTQFPEKPHRWEAFTAGSTASYSNMGKTTAKYCAQSLDPHFRMNVEILGRNCKKDAVTGK